jgi:hypothetical protein
MDSDSLIVDLADPKAVRAKLPEVRAIRDSKRRDFEAWDARVRVLEQFAGEPDAETEATEPEPETAGAEPSSILDLVLEVVNREMRPIRAKDVYLTLIEDGIKVTPSSVSNSLYYGAKTAKKIQKLQRRGVYAPLEFGTQNSFDSANGAGSPTLETEGRRAPTA